MNRLFITCATAILLLSAFNTKKKSKLKLPAGFVFIPPWTEAAALPDNDDVVTEKPLPRVSYNSFYISRYEVSNLQYRLFYNEISAGLTESEKEKIACDTIGWMQEAFYAVAMKEYYYCDPVFNNHPAVNIPYEGAVYYCKWLQQKIQKDNPDYEIEVRLPDKVQWICAASGGRTNAMYPWGNYTLRNRKGEFLRNFSRLGDESIIRNKETRKAEIVYGRTFSSHYGSDFYIAPVKSYYPNDYGLYNVCGNVAEMISEKGIAMGGSWNDYGGDVHIRAETKFKSVSPTIGFRPVVTASEKKKK